MDIHALGIAYDSFIIEYGTWVMVVGAILLVGALAGYQHFGEVRRRQRFRARVRLEDSEWFSTYYPVGEGERSTVRAILQSFGDDVGIEWTRLRPTDTFEDMLRVERRYSPHDDLEEAELRIVSLAEKLGISEHRIPGFTGSLGSFLDQWIRLSGGDPPPRWGAT